MGRAGTRRSMRLPGRGVRDVCKFGGFAVWGLGTKMRRGGKKRNYIRNIVFRIKEARSNKHVIALKEVFEEPMYYFMFLNHSC